MPQHIFNSRSPIVVGVSVEAGVVKEGTPITIPSQEVGILCCVTLGSASKIFWFGFTKASFSL